MAESRKLKSAISNLLARLCLRVIGAHLLNVVSLNHRAMVALRSLMFVN